MPLEGIGSLKSLPAVDARTNVRSLLPLLPFLLFLLLMLLPLLPLLPLLLTATQYWKFRFYRRNFLCRKRKRGEGGGQPIAKAR